MKSYHLVLATGLILVWLVSSASNAKDPSPNSSSAGPKRQISLPEEAIRRALKTPLPEGPHQAAIAYDQLFSGASEATLRELAENPNPSIALQARWELRETDHVLPSDTAHPDYIPGFLEGDFGLRAPMPWAVEFAMSYSGNRDDRLLEFYREVGFAGIKKKLKFTIGGKEVWRNTVNLQPDLHRTAYGPLAARNIEIVKEGKKVRIEVENQSVGVSPDFFPKKGHYNFSLAGRDNGGLILANCIVAASDEGSCRAYVAVFEDAFAPASLMCIDLAADRVAWRSTIWGAYADFSPATSGPSYYDVQLVCCGKNIAVFGRGTHCPWYIESFDARTGENQLRFSSSYWDCRTKTSAGR